MAMILWLDRRQHHDVTVGIDGNVLRADEYGKVVEIHEALSGARAYAAAVVAAAEAEAEAIRARARADAQASDATAAARFTAAEARGFASGMQRALDEANGRMQERAHASAESTRRARSRLADIVMRAVEQIVLEADRDALFARIGVRLQRIIDDAAYVTLTVHPGDVARARVVLASARDEAGWHAAVEVTADASAAPGSCQVEWDDGVFVTGLDEELASLRRLLAQQVLAVPCATVHEAERA